MMEKGPGKVTNHEAIALEPAIDVLVLSDLTDLGRLGLIDEVGIVPVLFWNQGKLYAGIEAEFAEVLHDAVLELVVEGSIIQKHVGIAFVD